MNKLYIYAIAVSAVLVGLYFYGDSKYDQGYNDRDTIAVASALAAEQSARAKEQIWQDQLSKAQNEKTERERKLESDSANANAVNSRLQRDIASLRDELPKLTRKAIERYADTASVVFEECTAQYTKLAKTADRIDSDRKTLEDSWPR